MLQWPLQEAAEMMMIIIIIVILCVCYWLHVNAFYLSDFVYWPTPQLQMSFSHSVFWCHQLQQCSTSRPTNYTAFSATEWKPSAIILLHVSFGYSLCIWPSSTTCRCECLGIGLLHQVNILSQDRNGEYIAILFQKQMITSRPPHKITHQCAVLVKTTELLCYLPQTLWG